MIDLKNCKFSECHFREVNFQNVDFSGDDLTGAVFQNCNLTNVSFKEANLRKAVFIGVDFKKVNFEETKLDRIFLQNVRGIYQVGPIGAFGTAVAVDWGDKVMFYFYDDEGVYFWGSEEEIIEKVREIHGDDTLYEQQVRLAAKMLEAERNKLYYKPQYLDHF